MLINVDPMKNVIGAVDEAFPRMALVYSLKDFIGIGGEIRDVDRREGVGSAGRRR